MYLKSLVGGIILFLVSGQTVYCADWLRFQADNQHTGNSYVEFSSEGIQNIWTFRPSEHIWSYQKGSSVWSSSAVIAHLKDKEIVFVGFYNHNLYALDAKDGKIIWRFVVGGRLDSAPCFAEVKGRAIIYIVSSDRSVYALDAHSGEKIWSYETLKWSYTVSEAISSSPLVVSINGRSTLIFSIWNNVQDPFHNLQQGELFALDAESGEKIYSRVLSSTALNTPAFSDSDGKPVVFISARDGRVFALDAQDGRVLWEVTLCMEIYSSISISAKNDAMLLFVGSRFGNLYALDAKTGKILWTKKVGHAIDSTPAITTIDEKIFIYFGSYDRNVYCLEAETGKEIWRFRTGDYVASSCAIAKIANSSVVFVHSLDNKLYCLDGLNGSLIWSQDTGKLIWGYHRRGDTNWSSPAISTLSGKPLLIFPAYDGTLYAFSVAPKREEYRSGGLNLRYGLGNASEKMGKLLDK